MAKNKARVLAKYQRNIAGAGADYSAGVQDPKTDWLAAYAQAAPRMEAELQKAIAEGRAVKGAQRAGTDKWKKRAATIGAQRFTGAATMAAEAYGAVVDDVLAAGETASNAAKAMPQTTIQERVQASAAAQLAISEYWRRKKGQE